MLIEAHAVADIKTEALPKLKLLVAVYESPVGTKLPIRDVCAWTR